MALFVSHHAPYIRWVLHQVSYLVTHHKGVANMDQSSPSYHLARNLASCFAIGTELLKQRRRSRQRPKPLFAVFLWRATRLLATVSTQVNQVVNAWFLLLHINKKSYSIRKNRTLSAIFLYISKKSSTFALALWIYSSFINPNSKNQIESYFRFKRRNGGKPNSQGEFLLANPFRRIGMWRSPVAQRSGGPEVASSNLVIPTKRNNHFYTRWLYLLL